MIKISNLNKEYRSGSKRTHRALNGINLKIADRGMVFILGKSGSGKTTLLNLLGGLDSPTNGDISVNGASMAQFTQVDYDNYRNQFVGFVFQEFNLLNDFNVKDNVALALRLSDDENVDEKVLSALEKVGLSSEYLSRGTEELSGGEKQRVAIARAIVKESVMLLADEPTGNLDSATGEDIWRILKDLSKTQLVIAVSHDRASAEKYGDRIIEISDGQITADTGAGNFIETENRLRLTQKRLPAKICFKMGANNLLRRKVRAVSVILLSIFSIVALIITQLGLTYSSEKTIAQFIGDNNVKFFLLRQSDVNGNKSSGVFIKKDSLNYIADNSLYIIGGIIENKRDITDFGLNFLGDAAEIDDESFYVLSDALEMAIDKADSYVIIDGEEVKLVKELHPIESLVGKQIKIGCTSGNYYTLAGIIDSGRIETLALAAMPEFFATAGFGGRTLTGENSYNESWSQSEKEIIVRFNGNKYDGEITFGSSVFTATGYFEGRVLTADGLKQGSEITLADDEIILSFDLFKDVFSAYSKYYYVNPELTEIMNYPTELGATFNITVYEHGSGELLSSGATFRLYGVGFAPADYNSHMYTRYFCGTKTAVKKFVSSFDRRAPILVNAESVNDISGFLLSLRKDYNVYVYKVGVSEGSGISYAEHALDFEDTVQKFNIVFGILSAISTVILILFVINLISFSIMDRKKEIGILSALGTTKRDIIKIFVIETLIIAFAAFVVSLIVVRVLVGIFNAENSRDLSLILPLFRIDTITFITLVAASFGLLLLAAFIPLSKLSKMKPIDAIKGL